MNRTAALLVLPVLFTGAILAVDPPALIHYQGVLRDNNGSPENGAFEMTFTFFNNASIGHEILVDQHTNALGGAVNVSDGVFDVTLGGGYVSDGSGPGVYTSLDDVFRDYDTVWMSIRIGTETLTPRIRVVAAPYAHNASNLGGKGPGEYLDTSSSAQTKPGALTLSELDLTGPYLDLAGGNRIYSRDDLFVVSGDADTDTVRLVSGDTTDDGMIDLRGDAELVLKAGNGTFVFSSGPTGLVLGTLDSGGSLQIDGGLNADGPHSYFGSNLTLYSGSTVTSLYNNAASETMRLVGGNDLTTTHIELHGDGELLLNSATGLFRFLNAATDVEKARINDFGDLQIDGYLDDDGSIDFVDGSIAYVAGNPADFTLGGSYMELGLGDSSLDNVNIPGSLYVSGVKNFVQNHPARPDRTIHYTALEGDESGTYTRGSARLAGGEARVALNESFAWVTNPEIGLTAHVTPRGRPIELWVDSVTTSELVVRCIGAECDEAAFDYIVHGLRIGYEDHPVVQPKRFDAPLPPEGYFDAPRFGDAATRSATARERFSKNAVVAGDRARALREAIGTHPREEAKTRPDRAVRGEDAAAPAEAMRAPDVDAAPVPADAGAVIDRPVSTTTGVTEPLPGAGSSALTVAVVTDRPVEPGTVLAADPDRPSTPRVAVLPYDNLVLGVAVETGLELGGEETGIETTVAVAGIVSCRVDAAFGSVRPGDLLVASPSPGHAMLAVDPPPGTVLGKALEPIDSGSGVIRILLMLR